MYIYNMSLSMMDSNTVRPCPVLHANSSFHIVVFTRPQRVPRILLLYLELAYSNNRTKNTMQKSPGPLRSSSGSSSFLFRFSFDGGSKGVKRHHWRQTTSHHVASCGTIGKEGHGNQHQIVGIRN